MGIARGRLLSDTRNLNSPTTTPLGRLVPEELAKINPLNRTAFAEETFAVSPLLTLSPDQVMTADCKECGEDGRSCTVSQIAEQSFSLFPEKQDALLADLKR